MNYAKNEMKSDERVLAHFFIINKSIFIKWKLKSHILQIFSHFLFFCFNNLMLLMCFISVLYFIQLAIIIQVLQNRKLQHCFLYFVLFYVLSFFVSFLWFIFISLHFNSFFSHMRPKFRAFFFSNFSTYFYLSLSIYSTYHKKWL